MIAQSVKYLPHKPEDTAPSQSPLTKTGMMMKDFVQAGVMETEWGKTGPGLEPGTKLVL